MMNFKKITNGNVFDLTRKVFMVILSFFIVVVIAACDTKEKVTVNAIAVSSFPTKTVYKVGESFDKSGIEVIAVMSDQTVKKMSEGNGSDEYQLTGFDSSKIGISKVEIKSGAYETYFSVIINDNKDETKAQITFVNEDKIVLNELLNKGQTIKFPATPKKEGYYFVGWFIEETNYMWNLKLDQITQDTTLKAKFIKLDESHVILDAYMKEETQYAYKTLQDLKLADIKDNTTVYFAPGVYWTDDYKDPNDANTEEHPGLIGIEFKQKGLTFIGLTSNADDVRIAGNRGQTVGSKGNWNVIGVGTDFSAYNISIANYCSTDLVYPRDPSQNLKRRTDARVQAQTLATYADADKMYFENVNFVSHLNLMAAASIKRAYFKDCYFQLTDDAIAIGGINVYENCTFDLYGAHPTWGGIETIALFLNSKFNIKYDSGILYFAKSGGTFGLIDSVFTGKIDEVRWEDFQRPDAKHFVYNNKDEKGNDIIFAKDYPNVTQHLNSNTVSMFKAEDGTYNTYNILRGNDDWNPGKKGIIAPFKLLLASNVSVLESSDENNNVNFIPSIIPSNIVTLDKLAYTYDENLFDVISNDNGLLTLKARLNKTGKVIETVVKVSLESGLEAQKTISIRPEIVDAPKLVGSAKLAILNNTVKLSYEYDHSDYTDHSNILWYIGSTENKLEKIVAKTTLNNPLLTYQLSRTDLGKYVSAVILPKYEFSPSSENLIEVLGERVIELSDIVDKNIIKTNFANIAWNNSLITDKDVWYSDSHRPKDITVDWTESTLPSFEYTYGQGGYSGQGGALNKYGLLTVQRGARLLYNTSGEYSDVEMTINLSPEKNAGQGFGSATEQYLDIYIKYNPENLTGYALRIQRVAKDRNGNAIDAGGSAVRFSLVEYVNGIERVLDFNGNDIISSAFMPDTTINIKVIGNKFTADINTKSEQTTTQQGFNLPHSVKLGYTLNEVNSYGGFGFQHTGTVSNGNRLMLHELEVKLTSK